MSSAMTAAATSTANAVSVADTPSESATRAPTGSPETQDRPKSPCTKPSSHRRSRPAGPASSPSSRRTEASASTSASRSADLARSTVSAGSLPEISGNRPITAATAVTTTATTDERPTAEVRRPIILESSTGSRGGVRTGRR